MQGTYTIREPRTTMNYMAAEGAPFSPLNMTCVMVKATELLRGKSGRDLDDMQRLRGRCPVAVDDGYPQVGTGWGPPK